MDGAQKKVFTGYIDIAIDEEELVSDTLYVSSVIVNALMINEILYCGSDYANFYFYDQFVELYNSSEDTLYLDGPLTYMLGKGFSHDELRSSITNINRLLEMAKLKTLIIDHHLLRDNSWKDEIREIFARAEGVGKKVVTMAGFLGRDDVLLESRRGRLYEQQPGLTKEPIMRSSTFSLVKKLKK